MGEGEGESEGEGEGDVAVDEVQVVHGSGHLPDQPGVITT